MVKNNINHNMGSVITYDGSLTAIGGHSTAEVEVLQKNEQNETNWNSTIIPPVPETSVHYLEFTSLVIDDSIFLFGN